MIGGSEAVLMFFSISGFYMALVLNEKYSDSFLFYSNRALRLYPAYLVTLLGCIAWFWFVWAYTGKRPPPYWVAELPTTLRAMLAFSDWTMIGLDVPLTLHWVNQHIIFLPLHGDTEPSNGFWLARALWISHGWSIGMEIWFYAIAPFIVRRGWLPQLMLAGASFGLLIALETDRPLVSYFFPANLGFFIIGSLLYKFYRSILFRPLSALSAVFLLAPVCLMLFLAGFISGWIGPALLCAVPLSFPYLFEAFKKSTLDTFVGNLSYPIYLLHMLVISVLSATLKVESVVPVAIVTIVLAILTVRFVEEPLDKFRQKRARAAEADRVVGSAI